MKTVSSWAVALALTALVSACSQDDEEEKNDPTPAVKATVVSAGGNINAKLDEFRALLGTPVNTTPNQTAGRREVNWDGVPANLTNVNTFPGDFFNNTDPNGPAGRKRGLVTTISGGGAGAGFRISDNDFADLAASNGDQFNAFSPARTFATVGVNHHDVTFQVPGTTTAATVKGFGVVFSDVDDANATTMEFFEGDKSLGKFKAPVRSDAAGISFLGVFFPENKVSRVRVTTGNTALGANVTDGGSYDLVVVDDFLYDEPKAN
ncbi:hypothetical protein [Larkinella soli]|uniref:hypothetical protein n=1 Tax=Larkinella soli TaxID=1770527 RepID=UPI000FFC2A63|nr:hypothetical protein [Larkinella soli]